MQRPVTSGRADRSVALRTGTKAWRKAMTRKRLSEIAAADSPANRPATAAENAAWEAKARKRGTLPALRRKRKGGARAGASAGIGGGGLTASRTRARNVYKVVE